MEQRQSIQYYVKSGETQVVRAFCLKDFGWYDKNGMNISLSKVTANRGLSAQVGRHYTIDDVAVNGPQLTARTWATTH